jgi:lipopolysaccharide export system permease protein
MKVLDRYIFQELIANFLMAVLCTTVLLVGDYMLAYNDVLFERKVPTEVIVQVILLKMPAYIVLAVPMGVLFSVVLTLSRLGRESELAAMRTGGVSLVRIMIPCMAFGLLASILSFWIYEDLTPRANHKARKLETDYLMSRALDIVKTDRFLKGPKNTTLRVEDQDKQGESRNLQVIKHERNFSEWIIAGEGTFLSDRLVLKDNIHFNFNSSGELTESMKADRIVLDIGREVNKISGLTKTPFERDSEELKEWIKQWNEAKVELPREKTELYFKYSIPCAAFIFTLIGLPLSLQTPRKEVLFGILICVGLITVYYLVMTGSKGAGYHGELDPRLAAWLPNLFFGGIGVGLILWVRRS